VKPVLLPIAERTMSNAWLTIWFGPAHELAAPDAINRKRSTIDLRKIDCGVRPSGFGSNVRNGSMLCKIAVP
jgi:hypothetical protein